MILTHYANPANLRAIWKSRILQCAFLLMSENEKARHAGKMRAECLPLSQALLRNHAFDEKSAPPDYAGYLDKHVFFWSDTAAGDRYRLSFHKKHPQDVGLLCCLHDLREANPGDELLWSPINSGSTLQYKHKCKREKSTNLFEPLPKRMGRVVEVVARNKIRLPKNTMCEQNGELRRFFTRKFPFSP